MELFKQAFQKPGAATAALNYYRALLFYRRPHTPAMLRALRSQVVLGCRGVCDQGGLGFRSVEAPR